MSPGSTFTLGRMKAHCPNDPRLRLLARCPNDPSARDASRDVLGMAQMTQGQGRRKLPAACCLLPAASRQPPAACCLLPAASVSREARGEGGPSDRDSCSRRPHKNFAKNLKTHNKMFDGPRGGANSSTAFSPTAPRSHSCQLPALRPMLLS